MLLVEHHMNLVMRVSDQVVALDFGRKIADGTPAEVQRQPDVDPRLSRGRRVSAPPLLEVRGLHAPYGPTQVLHGIDFAVADGGITTLLGANGAGKTTTAARHLQHGAHAAARSRFAGERIDGQATEDDRAPRHRPRARRPRHLRQPHRRGEPAARRATRARDRGGVAADFERVYGYFPRLKERRRQQAGTLSGGEQQMLAISRALMLRPHLLLLDEPSFGLAPLIVQEIFRILRAINQQERSSMLLVEQNAASRSTSPTTPICSRPAASSCPGRPQTIRSDESIRRSYLGY